MMWLIGNGDGDENKENNIFGGSMYGRCVLRQE